MRIVKCRAEKTVSHTYEFARFNPPLKILTTGVSRFREGDNFSYVRKKYFSLNVITAGDARFRQGTHEGPLGTGDVFLAHRGLGQHFSTGPSGYLHKRFIIFDTTTVLDSMLHDLGLVERDWVRPRGPAAMIALFRRCYNLMREKRRGFTEETSRICFAILQELGRSTAPEYPPEIRNAIEFMRRNLDRAICLEEVVGQVRLSVRHFTRLFTRHVGSSPMQFYNGEKVGRAKSLLENTTMSVKEIAAAVGYEDPLYFSARFRKYAGRSPRHYRETVLQEE